jgi:hypothetical protein
MGSIETVARYDEQSSYLLSISEYTTCGFCTNYPLRRHKFEAEANAGCHEARQDWAKYVGPTEQFGGCNPINGNFSAVVLPLCKPKRLRLVAYILECKFAIRRGFLGQFRLHQ